MPTPGCVHGFATALTSGETRLFLSANGTFPCQPGVERREPGERRATPGTRPAKAQKPQRGGPNQGALFSLPNMPFINLDSLSLA